MLRRISRRIYDKPNALTNDAPALVKAVPTVYEQQGFMGSYKPRTTEPAQIPKTKEQIRATTAGIIHPDTKVVHAKIALNGMAAQLHIRRARYP